MQARVIESPHTRYPMPIVRTSDLVVPRAFTSRELTDTDHARVAKLIDKASIGTISPDGLEMTLVIPNTDFLNSANASSDLVTVGTIQFHEGTDEQKPFMDLHIRDHSLGDVHEFRYVFNSSGIIVGIFPQLETSERILQVPPANHVHASSTELPLQLTLSLAQKIKDFAAEQKRRHAKPWHLRRRRESEQIFDYTHSERILQFLKTSYVIDKIASLNHQPIAITDAERLRNVGQPAEATIGFNVGREKAEIEFTEAPGQAFTLFIGPMSIKESQHLNNEPPIMTIELRVNHKDLRFSTKNKSLARQLASMRQQLLSQVHHIQDIGTMAQLKKQHRKAFEGYQIAMGEHKPTRRGQIALQATMQGIKRFVVGGFDNGFYWPN